MPDIMMADGSELKYTLRNYNYFDNLEGYKFGEFFPYSGYIIPFNYNNTAE